MKALEIMLSSTSHQDTAGMARTGPSSFFLTLVIFLSLQQSSSLRPPSIWILKKVFFEKLQYVPWNVNHLTTFLGVFAHFCMIKTRREQRSCTDWGWSLSPLRQYNFCWVTSPFWENYLKPPYKQCTGSFRNKLKEKLKVSSLQYWEPEQ